MIFNGFGHLMALQNLNLLNLFGRRSYSNTSLLFDIVFLHPSVIICNKDPHNFSSVCLLLVWKGWSEVT